MSNGKTNDQGLTMSAEEEAEEAAFLASLARKLGEHSAAMTAAGSRSSGGISVSQSIDPKDQGNPVVARITGGSTRFPIANGVPQNGKRTSAGEWRSHNGMWIVKRDAATGAWYGTNLHGEVTPDCGSRLAAVAIATNDDVQNGRPVRCTTDQTIAMVKAERVARKAAAAAVTETTPEASPEA